MVTLAPVMGRKRRQQDVVDGLRQRLPPHEIQQIAKLMDLLLEDAKNNLLTCNPADFQKMQGEAQAYKRVADMLTRTSFASQTTTQE